LLREEDVIAETEFEGTTVGGLSAITYNFHCDVYYLITDDHSSTSFCFYTATIDLDSLYTKHRSASLIKILSGRDDIDTFRWQHFWDLDLERIQYTKDGTLLI
jgi:hypothetical protein